MSLCVRVSGQLFIAITFLCVTLPMEAWHHLIVDVVRKESGNDRYVGYAMLAYCVQAIDGVPVPAPASEAQLEALVARLGDTGLAAVGEALAEGAPGPN